VGWAVGRGKDKEVKSGGFSEYCSLVDAATTERGRVGPAYQDQSGTVTILVCKLGMLDWDLSRKTGLSPLWSDKFCLTVHQYDNKRLTIVVKQRDEKLVVMYALPLEGGTGVE
jgi:hypothetical protein